MADFPHVKRRLASLIHRLRGGAADDDHVASTVDPRELRYVYRVVVDGQRDERLLVRDRPAQLDDVVPFRGQDAVVERISETHERDASGNDLRERVEADPQTQIMRTLHCRLPAAD